MINIILKSLKQRRLSIIIYSLFSLAMLTLYSSLFPSFQAESQSFSEVFKNLPEAISKAFGINQTTFFNYYDNFLSSEFYSLTWPLVFSILLISSAGNAIAGEIDKGTIQILLAMPVSRMKLFWSKYLTGLLELIIFIATSTLAAVPIALFYDISFNHTSIYLITISGALFGLAVYSITFMLSAIFSERSRVYAISGALLVIMYVANIFASLKESWSDLKYISFFHYFNASAIVTDQKIEPISIIIFLSISLIFTILALAIFSRRDIAVE